MRRDNTNACAVGRVSHSWLQTRNLSHIWPLLSVYELWRIINVDQVLARSFSFSLRLTCMALQRSFHTLRLSHLENTQLSLVLVPAVPSSAQDTTSILNFFVVTWAEISLSNLGLNSTISNFSHTPSRRATMQPILNSSSLPISAYEQFLPWPRPQTCSSPLSASTPIRDTTFLVLYARRNFLAVLIYPPLTLGQLMPPVSVTACKQVLYTPFPVSNRGPTDVTRCRASYGDHMNFCLRETKTTTASEVPGGL